MAGGVRFRVPTEGAIMNHHTFGPRLERRDFVSAWLTGAIVAAGLFGLAWAVAFW
jgi:hypothetical protein